VINSRYLEAWRHVLELSRVCGEETVCILIGANSHPETVEVATLAATMTGANVFKMELGPPRAKRPGGSAAHQHPTALASNAAAVGALKCSDFVIDLMGVARGSDQAEILNAGTRILLAKEPPDILMRLLPSEADKHRVRAAAGLLGAAKTMSITSDSGTDLTVEVGEYPLLEQYGFADEPGHWDHWPGAFVATWPNEGSATGRVVLSPGDMVLPFNTYVRSEVSLDIEGGYIRKIGGTLDARYLLDYMNGFNDREGFAVSHLGWGLHPEARWTDLGMSDKQQTAGMAARSFTGCFMFSTGPNSEAGGDRHTPCHLDIPMLDCSLTLDGTPILSNGQLTQMYTDQNPHG
jgi:2,5-dihydroxypyridine 5,6-dioxygenase